MFSGSVYMISLPMYSVFLLQGVELSGQFRAVCGSVPLPAWYEHEHSQWVEDKTVPSIWESGTLHGYSMINLTLSSFDGFVKLKN